MESSRTHAVLNAVLAAEARYLAARLPESTVFTRLGTTAELETIQVMANQHARTMQQLVEVLYDLGGDPEPVSSDITTADLHYIDLHVALPRVLTNQRKLVELYDRAVAALEPCPRAWAVVSKIAANHRTNLQLLTEMFERSAAASQST